MQEPEHLIRVRHIADPRIPCRVFQTVSETGGHEDDDEDGVRGVAGDDDVGDELADGA